MKSRDQLEMLTERDNRYYEITLKCTTKAKEDLEPLLKELQKVGKQEVKRTVRFINWNGKQDFVIHGDDDFKIRSIKVNGAEKSLS